MKKKQRWIGRNQKTEAKQQEHYETELNINREGRKEKRKLMKMEEWLDDHAT